MLVLSRRENEVICIGDDIKVTIVRIGPDAVKVGVDAPLEIPVHRKEVYDHIMQQRSARPGTPSDPSGTPAADNGETG